jgi:hypothetical protein
MFNKKLIAAAVAMAAGMAFAGNASALTITAGAYKMTVDAFANGTLYPSGTAGTITCGSASNGAGDIADCDTEAAFTAVGGVGSEDTWGILSVALITNTTLNTTMFSKGADGYIIGYFSGLTDFYSTVLSATTQQDYSVGGTVNLYLSNTDYDPTVPSSNQANVIASVTNLPLYLSLDFAVGAGDPTLDPAAGVATYTSFLNRATGNGQGSGFLNVTGGTAATTFDTNGQTTGIGTIADAKLTVTLGSLSSGDAACTVAPDGTVLSPPPPGGDPLAIPQECNWLTGPTLDVRGETTIPEPATLVLLGLGLVGLGAMRRRNA